MLRLEVKHREAEDFRFEDFPFILTMEERAVGVVSESEIQLSKLFLIHLRMTVQTMAYICRGLCIHWINVLINGQPLALELDTGAATYLIHEDTYR